MLAQVLCSAQPTSSTLNRTVTLEGGHHALGGRPTSACRETASLLLLLLHNKGSQRVLLRPRFSQA